MKKGYDVDVGACSEENTGVPLQPTYPLARCLQTALALLVPPNSVNSVKRYTLTRVTMQQVMATVVFVWGGPAECWTFIPNDPRR